MSTGSENLSNFVIINDTKVITQISIAVLTKCKILLKFYNFVIVVQSLKSCIDSVTPWTTACLASLSLTISQRLLRLMSIELMMPTNHLILCHLLLLLPSVFPSIKVFSSESALHIRWLKYWSFSFSINLPMNNQFWFPLGLTDLISLLSKGLSKSLLQHHS